MLPVLNTIARAAPSPSDVVAKRHARAALGLLLAGLVALALAPSSALAAALPYTAYVPNSGSGVNTVTPINTNTNLAGSNISLTSATAVAITPDGTTAWVCSSTGGTIVPITLA